MPICGLFENTQTLCNTGRYETPGERTNRILRAWGIFILCGLLLLTAWAEWINQTNGLRTLLVSRNGREEGMVGVKPHTLENELLSLKPKSHMMGKQRSGTTLWQHLVSDFSLTATTAFSWFWEGREPGKLIKRKIAWGVGMRSNSWGKKRREGREMRPWITGSL